MTQPTQEPWSIIEYDPANPYAIQEGEVMVVDVQGVSIAKCYQQPGDVEGQALANARVIAVAKDAIAILERLKRQLPELDDPDAPLNGDDAVDVLCGIWQDLTDTLMMAGEG